jgi:hypothetical protein
MHLPPPWAFALVGSLLTVGSTVVGGFIAWKLEREEKKIEADQRSSSSQLVKIRERASEGIVLYQFAQIKLSLTQVVPRAWAKVLYEQAASAALQAITFRNEAAGNPLTDDEIKHLGEPPLRAHLRKLGLVRL